MPSERIPPHDLNAEMSLLGAMMLSARVEVPLSSDDFYSPRHGHIFTAISTIRDRGEAVDAVTVAAELQATGKLDAAGGKMYLLDVTSETPIAANANEYARIVQQTATLRAVIKHATDAIVNAYEGANPAEVLGDTITDLLSLQQSGGGSEMTAADLIRQRLNEYRNPTDTIMLPGSSVRIHFGDTVVIGGRPGTGKTALAVQIADALTANGRKAAFLSYEMNIEEIADRLISRKTKQPSDFAYDGLSEGEIAVFERACASLLTNRNLTLKHATGMRESELAAFIRKFAHSGGQVVIIDYLQIAFDDRGNENSDLTRLMRLIQRIGKSTGVVVIGLSQYSREGDGQPRLKHLRGSGSIEQEAANVALMWSPDDDDQPEYKRKIREQGYIIEDEYGTGKLVKIQWAKVRHGATHNEYCMFNGASMHIEPLDKELR